MTAYEPVLDFWFGAPAHDAGRLLEKFRRWYVGDPALDRAIGERFGALVEEALAGGLAAWEADPRGALALIVLLDQFARNLFRDAARAYAGDARAQALAVGLLDGGRDAALSPEERIFVLMPLVHAERPELQARVPAAFEALLADAPAGLRDAFALGRERTRLYRTIVERFGRFPHRNAALGRASTAAERAFLADEAERRALEPPAPVAGAR
jgi:uncharacterized protein (DUF924 family)